ncbi:MAG: ArsR/SmtB family transcription factor [Candidatus Hodarchaeales archaeon]
MKDRTNKVEISEEDKAFFELQADLCQSLTHPFRLKLLHLLKDGEKNVNTIKDVTKERQPYISQHLKVLRDKGVVTTRRDHNEIYYSLADPKIIEVCEMVAYLIKKRQEQQTVSKEDKNC